MKTFGLSLIALATAAAPALAEMNRSDMIRARDMIGNDIYTTNEAHDEGSWMDVDYNEVGADWNDVGEVEDIVLDMDGKMIGVIAEVGGFMDIADKHVFLGVDELRVVPEGYNEYAIVTRHSEEQLEEREAMDESWFN